MKFKFPTEYLLHESLKPFDRTKWPLQNIPKEFVDALAVSRKKYHSLIFKFLAHLKILSPVQVSVTLCLRVPQPPIWTTAPCPDCPLPWISSILTFFSWCDWPIQSCTVNTSGHHACHVLQIGHLQTDHQVNLLDGKNHTKSWTLGGIEIDRNPLGTLLLTTNCLKMSP